MIISLVGSSLGSSKILRDHGLSFSPSVSFSFLPRISAHRCVTNLIKTLLDSCGRLTKQAGECFPPRPESKFRDVCEKELGQGPPIATRVPFVGPLSGCVRKIVRDLQSSGERLPLARRRSQIEYLCSCSLSTCGPNLSRLLLVRRLMITMVIISLLHGASPAGMQNH